jgi:RsiW-degrading membrane proteinase PrsW (M82 family)
VTGDLARVRALLITRLVIAGYLVEVLLNLIRPHVLPDEPALSIFQTLPGASGSFARLLNTPRAVFWCMLAGIAAGLVIQAYVAITRPRGRRAVTVTWAMIVVLLGPFTLISLVIITSYPLVVVACVPGTAFALWLLHICQRFARVGWPVLLAAFAWGALLVFSLGRAYSGLADGTIFGLLLGKLSAASVNSVTTAEWRSIDLLILHLSVVNELIVAAGVLLLLLMFRYRRIDTVTGLVLGASIGLGCNFVESVLYIQIYGSLGSFLGSSGGFEYWIRQSIGLLGGQVTFGAIIGAGIGTAFQTRQRERRRLIAWSAIVTATGGAVAAEVLSGWLSHLTAEHLTPGGALDTLVISPLLWLLPQAPFIVVAGLLLTAGLRARDAAARAAISAEAGHGGGAITAPEVRYLADPGMRLWTVAGTWRRHGRGAALALRHLQAAQLDLAAWRWQQQPAGSGEDPAAREEGDSLRAKVIRLKTAAATRPTVTS